MSEFEILLRETLIQMLMADDQLIKAFSFRERKSRDIDLDAENARELICPVIADTVVVPQSVLVKTQSMKEYRLSLFYRYKELYSRGINKYQWTDEAVYLCETLFVSDVQAIRNCFNHVRYEPKENATMEELYKCRTLLMNSGFGIRSEINIEMLTRYHFKDRKSVV